MKVIIAHAVNYFFLKVYIFEELLICDCLILEIYSKYNL